MLSKGRVKYIQSLGQKKSRDEEAVFIAEGPKLAAEFLTGKTADVKELYALKEWVDANSNLTGSCTITEISKEDLERISQLKTPNQVLAVVNKFWVNEHPDLKNKITLVLDTIQDPGNMGTIIRIADWFGIENIICSNDCADMYNPKVVQASMGSIARVNIIYTELKQWLNKNKVVKIFAAALDGKPLASATGIKEGLVIIGNESKGIEAELLSVADEKISIPKKGNAESLNAAVAAGIILSHIT